MTPVEAKAAFAQFRKEIGSEAWTSISLTEDTRYGTPAVGPLSCTIYPEGITRSGRDTITVYADDFEPLLSAARAKWAEFAATHRKNLIRAMALEIIRVTADLGECTDASLRSARFQAEDVERYGEAACADACEIASRGPFTIRIAGRGNAPAHLSEDAA